jgi:hypothetical protein
MIVSKLPILIQSTMLFSPNSLPCTDQTQTILNIQPYRSFLTIHFLDFFIQMLFWIQFISWRGGLRKYHGQSLFSSCVKTLTAALTYFLHVFQQNIVGNWAKWIFIIQYCKIKLFLWALDYLLIFKFFLLFLNILPLRL